MIKKLKIENFKSIKNSELNCRKINVFIGEPNTGKSNILEALGILSFLRYSAVRILDLNDFVRFKNFQDIFFERNVLNVITIETDLEELNYRFALKILQDKNNPHKFNFVDPLENLIASIGINGEILNLDPDFVPKFDVRFFRFYPLTQIKKDNTPGGLLPPYGQNLTESLKTNKEVSRLISSFIEDFGFKLILPETEGDIEIFREIEKNVLLRYPYSTISDTLQRIIFFTVAKETNSNCVMTFEEPEAHAFPYYVKFISESIALDDKNNQFFITTHNPYFLISILEKSEKDDIAIFVTKMENYETKIKEINEEGKSMILDMGPDVFLNLDKLFQ